MLEKRLNSFLKRFTLKAWLVDNHAFFVFGLSVFLLFFPFPSLADVYCSLGYSRLHSLQQVKLKYVSDGDSVVLAGGQKLRLISVNTPELHNKQVLAIEARQVLQGLLVGQDLYLKPGIQKKDKYGRLLAELYLSDGRNVSAQMLGLDWGFLVAIPPNVDNVSCMKAARDKAKAQRLGVWAMADYKARSSASFKSGDAGFQRIKGRMVSVKKTGAYWWLRLQGDVVLRIKAGHQANFEWGELQKGIGRRVLVSGWMIDRGLQKSPYRAQFMLLLTHNAHLEIL